LNASSSSFEDESLNPSQNSEPNELLTRASIESDLVLQKIANLPSRSRKSLFDLRKKRAVQPGSRDPSRSTQVNQLQKQSETPPQPEPSRSSLRRRSRCDLRSSPNFVTLERFLSQPSKENRNQLIGTLPPIYDGRSLPTFMIELWQLQSRLLNASYCRCRPKFDLKFVKLHRLNELRTRKER